MKKLVFFALICIILYFSFQTAGAYEEMIPGPTYQVIPDEAIRLRILANSDDEADQQVKRFVRDEVSEQISGWVEDIDDIDEARQMIQSRIPEITETAEMVVKDHGMGTQKVQVDYGKNVTFPIKLYDTYLYPAGEYEAVLITIGEGKGANWWCVLFPPLCFLDFSNGALVADDLSDMENTDPVEEEVKINFFLFEWFGWTQNANIMHKVMKMIKVKLQSVGVFLVPLIVS